MNFAVIGHPITQSLSPTLHTEIFRHAEINAVYSALDVSENELPHILQRMKTGEFDGLNVTIPYKSLVMESLDLVNPRAQTIGAVNCILKKENKLIGNNTDWFGFSMALRENNILVSGKEILVLGSGGAARAIVFALKHAGAKNIRVFNRTPNLKLKLAGVDISPHWIEHLENFVQPNSIIINCTPVGMFDNSSPMLKKMFSSKQTIIDIIYTPLITQFLKFGHQAGAKTLGGQDMLIFQAIQSLEIWLEKRILGDLNLNLIRQKLKQHLSMKKI